MRYRAKVAVCSEIPTKHSTLSENTSNFLILILVLRKENAKFKTLFYEIPKSYTYKTLLNNNISIPKPEICFK